MSLLIKAWWVRGTVSKNEIKLESWVYLWETQIIWRGRNYELIKAFKFVISSMFAAKSKFLKKENLLRSLKS